MNPLPGIIRYDRKDRVSGQFVHVYQHRSGFKIDLIPKEGFRNKYAGFLIPYGAEHTRFRDIEDGSEVHAELGTAHFLEHCLLSSQDSSGIMSALTALGVDVDAYTASDHTLYSFSTVESFDEALYLYFKAMFAPEFNDEKTEREKEIINAEYNMYKEDLSSVASRVLLRNMYRIPELYEDILGTAESISRITTSALEQMHRNFYTAATMSLVLVGSFDETALITKIAGWLDELAGNGKHRPEIMPLVESEGGVVSAEQRLELPYSTSSFWLGYRSKMRNGSARREGSELLRSRVAGQLVLAMLIGPGSQAFEEFYADGLVDESLSFSYTVEPEYAYLMISGDSMQPERAAEKISRRLEGLVKDKIYDDNRMTELIRSSLGRFLRSLDDVSRCGEAAAKIRLSHLEFSDFASVYYHAQNPAMTEELSFVRAENRASVIVHGRKKGRDER